MIQRTELPDPDAFSDADVVIYDGHCNFCRSQINTLHRFDCCGHRLAYLSLHDPRTSRRYPDLTHEMLMEQMYVIDRQGQRHEGSNAVRYLTRRLPTLWIAAPPYCTFPVRRGCGGGCTNRLQNADTNWLANRVTVIRAALTWTNEESRLPTPNSASGCQFILSITG